MLTMTNATKGNIIALINAIIALVVSFGVNLTDVQQAALVGCVNTALVVWIGFTYKDSFKRIPDEYTN